MKKTFVFVLCAVAITSGAFQTLSAQPISSIQATQLVVTPTPTPVQTQLQQTTTDTTRDLTIDTIYDKKSGMFTTKGRLESRVDGELLAEIVESVDEYDSWALTDINKGFKERGLLVMIRKLSFDSYKSELTTVFDLNLPWPFDFKDMTMPLYEQKKEYGPNEQLKFLRYGMKKHSITLNQFDVDFIISSENGMGFIDFEFKVRIASLLDAFVSRERYVKNVQGRIAQLMLNLRNHALDMPKEE